MTCCTTYKTTKYDPTRTTTLRNQFVREVRRRFNELTNAIVQVIATDDGFGLKGYNFSYGTTAQKVDSFMAWLNAQVEAGLLETRMMARVGGGAMAQPWTSIYILRSYERGVQRSIAEMRKIGISIDSTAQQAMAAPYHIDRLALLYTRTYSELKGITAQMEQQISRVLTDGIAQGDNPRLIAEKLNNTIKGGKLDMTDSLGRHIPAQRRAVIMARTEIIRAHHLATINEYRHWGVAGVSVQAEWSTADDDRVCVECAGMQGHIYTLEQIESMIPVHPQCRCMALPVVPEKLN
jgi:SPP1 gp7 family putative phage head morphogenesis protein